MELKKRVLSFKFEGKEINVKFPTVIQMRDYGIEAKKLKEGDSKFIDLMLDFLVKLGLPSELKEELEHEHVMKIMDSITPKKEANEGN